MDILHPTLRYNTEGALRLTLQSFWWDAPVVSPLLHVPLHAIVPAILPTIVALPTIFHLQPKLEENVMLRIGPNLPPEVLGQIATTKSLRTSALMHIAGNLTTPRALINVVMPTIMSSSAAALAIRRLMFRVEKLSCRLFCGGVGDSAPDVSS